MTKTKKTKHLTPAQVVVNTFGGVRATARVLSLRSPGTVSRWQSLRAGRVPSKHHVPLLEAAAQLKKKLTADDLVRGRLVSTRG